MGDDARLIPIGRFSQLTRLSLKALRLYDENGLLRPAAVDGHSGYRYYRASQARRARTIRLLRSVGMSLYDVGRVLDEPRADQRVALLHAWWQGMEARLEERRRTVAHIAGVLDEEEDTMNFEVQLKDLPARPVLSRSDRIRVDRLDGFITRSIGELRAEAARIGVAVAGAPFAIYHGEVNEQDDGPVEVCLPVADARETADGPITSRTLGATRAAFTTVDAANAMFPEIIGAYDAVAAWIEERGFEMADPPNEIYLADPENAAAGEPCLEIAWPVRDASTRPV